MVPAKITPVAGLIFETKNRAIFSGELFSGEDQLSIHFTSLLDYLKSSEHYYPRTAFSGSNSSPEKSSSENIARFLSRKSVLRPA